MLTPRMPPHSLINLLYPPACLLCRAPLASGAAGLCQACERAMTPCGPPVCQRCGLPRAGAYDARLVCPSCERRQPAFDKARAPFVYTSPVRAAVHAFKYDGHRRLGRWLAHRMAQTAAHEVADEPIDRVVPVPMHWAKRRLTGLNPAEWLASAVAAQLGLSCDVRTLRRVKWTPTQTRLTRTLRLRNVREAFAASGSSLKDCTILLVDDVLTSGATAQACAQALRAHGAARVLVLTAARAVPE